MRRVHIPNVLRGLAVAVLLASPTVILFLQAHGSIGPGYGCWMFIAVPFAVGLLAALVRGWRTPCRLRSSLAAATWAIVGSSILLLVAWIEGIICIVMALPLALPLALLGGWIGHQLQAGRWRPASHPVAYSIAWLALPLIALTETAVAPEPPLYAVRTAIEIDAPPERVWRHVVSFSELPPPTDWLFHTGVAYPIRAEIDGTGVGAIRRCVFSTGTFVEPIEVWDEPLLLRFSVTDNPPPLDELNPFGEVHPAHLEGHLVSERGQFLLTPLPGGRTLLEGTTWYRHGLWPASYWRLWSDFIIHRIHLRVLRHVETLAEAP